MNPLDLLNRGLNEIGCSCSDGQLAAFLTFLGELKKWSRVHSLTSLTSDRDIILKHFVDSALYVKALPPGCRRAGDVGTGAGFPGIPMKILKPGMVIDLIEPSKKKSAFLRHVIRVLRLKGIKVVEERLEDLGNPYRNTYDIMVSRATFRIGEFIDGACPYVKANGSLVLSKGPRIHEELTSQKNRKAIKEVLEFSFSGLRRNLVVITCRPGLNSSKRRPIIRS